MDTEVVIVGAGFGGIGAAIALQRIGMRDFVLLEKAGDVGGTWRDNDYPGLTVDMPSFIYSYAFEMSPEWDRVYPSGRELKAYSAHCADKYGIRSRIRFHTTLTASVYDAEQNLWRNHLEGGEVISSRYLVSASGLLVQPKMPEIPGLADFEGKLVHSARWDHACDLSGKRVAVIGTGATAVQLVPAIVERVRRLDLYQRTPIWLMPKPDAAISPALKRAFRVAPFLQRLVRFASNALVEVTMGMGFVRYTKFPWIFDWLEKKLVEYIRSEVHDPAIQEKLIPKYSFFCKRPSFSNVYYSVFNRANVELVTDPIERITKNSIVTRDGVEREIDALICATGYRVFDRQCMPGFEVVGRDGKNLGDFWEQHRFQAYGGAAVPGFPNFFLILGPYAASGASYFHMIDTQARYLTRCLRAARRRGANCIEVKQAAHERDFARVERRRRTTVLFGGNCAPAHSYYFDARGDTPGVRPVTGLEHWLASRFFPLRDFDFARRPL